MKSAKAVLLGKAPRIIFDVTKELINDGVSRNSNHCMVAEGLKSGYPELKYVAVDIQTIRASDPEKRERYVWITPRSVQQMIVDFDRGRKPKPFKVYLRDGQVIESGRTNDKGYKKKKAALRKSRGSRRSVPQKVGGKTPPKAIGQRRAYGLRSLIL